MATLSAVLLARFRILLALTYRPYRISSRITENEAFRGSGRCGATSQASPDWTADPAICPTTMLQTPKPATARETEVTAWASAPVSSHFERERKSMFRSRSDNGIV